MSEEDFNAAAQKSVTIIEQALRFQGCGAVGLLVIVSEESWPTIRRIINVDELARDHESDVKIPVVYVRAKCWADMGDITVRPPSSHVCWVRGCPAALLKGTIKSQRLIS